MLGNGIYAAMGTGYTPPGQTVIYDSGVIRNPASPTQITATTPLGIAFKSIGGGNYVQYSPPGVYGYEPLTPGSFTSPASYLRAANTGCIYPYSNLVYNTVTQTWTTKTTTTGGVTTASYQPQLPWTTVTHWFYSSYLTTNNPPSKGEIIGQIANNQDIPSVPLDPAQAGGNIGGQSTYNANPSPAVPTTLAACPSSSTVHGASVPNDLHTTSTYPTTGLDNCSLYVVASATAGQTAVNPSFTGSCFDPANTPGQTYAAQSCQAYGSQYYTFFWNDMGGASTDDKNYANGIVQLSCASASHVVLIQ